MAIKKRTKKATRKGTKASKARKTAPAKTAKPKGDKPKKLSALDAVVQVLAASKEPMNAKEMIDAMAAKGLWKSPGGKTPWATLYSAIIREVAAKGKEARFKKTERGKFATNR